MLSIDLVAISFYPQRVLLNFGKKHPRFSTYTCRNSLSMPYLFEGNENYTYTTQGGRAL